MTDYAAVLTDLYPGAQWSLSGVLYSGLTWLSEGDAPSQEELDAAWPAVQVTRANAQAAANRVAAYAAEADPLFFYWQAGEGTEQAWLEKRAEIRDRYPYVELEES
jgi:hypothetical protein